MIELICINFLIIKGANSMNLFSTIADDSITWDKIYFCTEELILDDDFKPFDFNIVTIPTDSMQLNYPIDWLPCDTVDELIAKDKSHTLSHYYHSNYFDKREVYLRTLEPLINANGNLEQVIPILYYAYLYPMEYSKTPLLSYSVLQTILKPIRSELQKNNLQPHYFGKSKHTLPQTFTPFLSNLNTPCELSIELLFKIMLKDIYDLSQTHKIIMFNNPERIQDTYLFPLT